MPRVLATKLVVEKPLRRASGPMSPMNWAPVGQRFGSVSPSVASCPNWQRNRATGGAPSGQSAASLKTFETKTCASSPTSTLAHNALQSGR
jgi:hypothetical protein